jgi:germination protein, Ger(x)C family
MTAARKLLPPLALLLLLTGCFDRLDMEDASMSLVAGIDVEENGEVYQYTSIPIFAKNSKKKSQSLKVKSTSLRQGRGKFDTFTVGSFNGRKIQVIVVSKRLIETEHAWFRFMDVYFRDGRNPITSHMIVFDGPLSQLYEYTPPNQTILPIALLGVVKSTSSRSEAVKTTLQELHTQMYEFGQTPAVTEVELKQDLRVKGTSLLAHDGRYVTSLDSKESALLLILKKKNTRTVGFSFEVPKELVTDPEGSRWISFTAEKIKVKIRTAVKGGRFSFDIRIRMAAGLMEKQFPTDIRAEQKRKLEAAYSEYVKKELEKLLDKLRENKVDPIGLGIYARAYHYGDFQKVKDHWDEAFSEADVNVAVNVKITDEGSVK